MPDKNLFLHSLKMAERNKRGYLFLSISISISFFLLLLYLFGYDTYLYNKYKYAFKAPGDIAIICETDENGSEINRYMKQLEKEEHVTFYQYCEQPVWLNQYGNCSMAIQRIPANIKCFYKYDDNDNSNGIQEVKIPQGDFYLKSDEMIVEKKFYDILKKQNNMVLSITQKRKGGKTETKKYKIVGYCEDIHESEIEVNEFGEMTGHMYAFALYDAGLEECINRRVLICSDNILSLVQLAQKFQLGAACPFVFQQSAMEEMQKASGDKLLMVITFLFFLSLNLFGNFRNTLEKRSYEIGVKRALGASKKEILGQFLIEGVIVMIGNIVLSAVLVINVLVLVKYIYFVQGRELILYMNQFSFLTYIICCIFLSFVFSVVFAYQAVNVEIIQYIKEG